MKVFSRLEVITMDEETAIATIFANTKRHKRVVDLLTIAECFEFLTKVYGSQEEVARKTDLSREMVREFLQILNLPPDIKDLIKARKIDSIDTAYRLTKLKDDTSLRTVVNKLSILQALDVRDVVRTTMENSETSVDTATEVVLKAKPKNVHVFIIDFTEENYKKLVSSARKRSCSPADLIKNIVDSWLSDIKDEDS
jgi:transcriptional regulator with XRE-family HTH domain